MSSSGTEIRLAETSDIPSISLLGRITFSETFAHLFSDRTDLLNYCDETFAVDKIAKSLQKSDSIYWLATVDKLPVGYAKLKLDSDSEFISGKRVCQLQKIYVLKDFLSLKIGFLLQDALLEKAVELNYEAIWLSVLDENIRAIRFYERNDFSIIGDHDFTIGQEHFDFKVMRKIL